MKGLRIAIVLAIVAAVLLVAWRSGLFALEDRAQLAAAIDRARSVPFVIPLFVLVYAIAAAAGVPASPLTLAGGALFGPWLGCVLNWTGAMLAATLAFFGTRATGLRATKQGDATATATALSGGHRATWTLFRLRLVPVVPFALLNAGAALGGMSWKDFLVATGVGIIPIIAIYTISASELVAGVAGSGARAFTLALGSAAVLIAPSFLPSLVRFFAKTKS